MRRVYGHIKGAGPNSDDFARLYHGQRRSTEGKNGIVEEQVVLSGGAQAQLAAEGALERFEQKMKILPQLEKFHAQSRPSDRMWCSLTTTRLDGSG